jgi:hypothetical protein
VAVVPVEKLDEVLIGAKTGEVKTVEVEVPKTFFREELRGKKVDIKIVVSQECSRISDLMVGVVCRSPGRRGGSMIARTSSLWESRTGQLNGVGSDHGAAERTTSSGESPIGFHWL